MSLDEHKSLGQVIDEVIAILEQLERAQQPTVIRAACQHLGIRVVRRTPLPPQADGHSGEPPTRAAPATAEAPEETSVYEDIRALKDAKKPSSTEEMVCLVVHYLESIAPTDEGKSEVGVADMKKYFKQAKYRLPKDMAKALAAAKRAGYLESVTRSKYRLTPDGHDLIDSMPAKK